MSNQSFGTRIFLKLIKPLEPFSIHELQDVIGCLREHDLPIWDAIADMVQMVEGMKQLVELVYSDEVLDDEN